MKLELKVRAKIYLFRLGTEYDYDGYSGMKPSFKAGKDLIMCKVIYGEPGSTIKREKEYCVTIELPYGRVYKEIICEGYKFTLNIASIVVGEGEVLEILD